MTLRCLCPVPALAALLFVTQPAAAEIDLGTVDACLTESLSAGTATAACVEAAHSTCMATDNEAPAVATLCFVEAEKGWQAGVSDLMARIAETAPEEIATIARIEVKYDLLSALLQCSRMEELSLAVGRDSDAAVLRQNARCKANAAGLSYARLYLRSRNLR